MAVGLTGLIEKQLVRRHDEYEGKGHHGAHKAPAQEPEPFPG